jgi:hypothetical protein
MELDWTHITQRAGAIEKTALDWNPQGYRRRGRPKRTWRRTIEGEIRGTRSSWNEVKGIAGDRINTFRPGGVLVLRGLSSHQSGTL